MAYIGNTNLSTPTAVVATQDYLQYTPEVENLDSQDNARFWSEYIKKIFNDDPNVMRKQESRILADNYDGSKQLQYLATEMGRIFSDREALRFKRKWAQNIVRTVVDSLGTIYTDQVKRDPTFKNKDVKKQIQEKLHANIQNGMDYANKMLIGQRTVLMHIFWSVVNERMEYRSYNQYNFDLVYDTSREDKVLQAVLISDFKPKQLEKTNIRIYTKNNYYEFVGDQCKKQNNHNEDFLPFLVINAETLPVDADYLQPMSILSNAQVEFNLAMANVLHMLHRQSNGVAVLSLPASQAGNIGNVVPTPISYTGMPTVSNTSALQQGPTMKSGIDDIMVLYGGQNGEKAELNYIDQKANFEDSIRVIEMLMKSISLGFSLPADTFEMTNFANKTATEITVKRDKLVKILQQYRNIFMDVEKQAYKIAIRVAKGELELPDNIDPKEYEVSFITDESPALTIEQIVLLKDKNLIDEVTIKRFQYPSLSKQEAEKKVIEDYETQKRIDVAKKDIDKEYGDEEESMSNDEKDSNYENNKSTNDDMSDDDEKELSKFLEEDNYKGNVEDK